MSGLNSSEIKSVYKKGKRVVSENFIVFYLPFEELKISPVVSKKVSKKAVIRNRNKRRIRHLAKLFFKSGRIAIVAKNDISGTAFESLKNEFKKLAYKIN